MQVVIRRTQQEAGEALPSAAASWLEGALRNASLLEESLALPAGGGQCQRCSAHGRCAGRACECEADWIGPRCEHHLLFHTHFLPPAAHAPGDVERAGLAAELSRAVDALQNPADCREPGRRFLTDTKPHPLALGHGLRSFPHTLHPKRPTVLSADVLVEACGPLR
jgi:hypothetical protein